MYDVSRRPPQALLKGSFLFVLRKSRVNTGDLQAEAAHGDDPVPLEKVDLCRVSTAAGKALRL